MVGGFNTINATLYEKLNFDFIRDIAPVASIDRVALVIVVNPTVPAKTVPEFISYAKTNPGKINMGSGGIGNGPTWPVSYSRWRPASTWFTSRIAAVRFPICSADRYK